MLNPLKVVDRAPSLFHRYASEENGGIAALLLFLLAIFVGLGMALNGGMSGIFSSSADEQNRITATSIMEQGTQIKMGVERILTNGETLTSIIVSTDLTGSTAAQRQRALFSPSGGGLTSIIPPNNATPNGNEIWRYIATANLPTVGTAGANDWVAVLPIKSQVLCLALNSLMFGPNSAQATAATIPTAATTPTAAEVTSALGVVSATNSMDLSGVASLAQRTQACVQDSGGAWWYYTTMQPG